MISRTVISPSNMRPERLHPPAHHISYLLSAMGPVLILLSRSAVVIVSGADVLNVTSYRDYRIDDVSNFHIMINKGRDLGSPAP